MRKTGKRRRMGTLRRRVSGRGGFTLAEMMAAMLIMLIASGLIAQTMTFAAQQTKKQYDTDDAYRAYADLVTAIRADLEYATGEFDFDIDNYTTPDDLDFAIKINDKDENDPTPTPDADNGSVIVEVTITKKNGGELLKRTFTVIPADAKLTIKLSDTSTT